MYNLFYRVDIKWSIASRARRCYVAYKGSKQEMHQVGNPKAMRQSTDRGINDPEFRQQMGD